MNIADAERQIIAEWRRWAPTNCPKDRKPNGTDALVFYGYLSSNFPDLLDFKCSGEKRQRIHGWLSGPRCRLDLS
jgi:hypothetical protein